MYGTQMTLAFIGTWRLKQTPKCIYIYIPKSRVQRYQPSDPRPAYFCRLNIVSLEHRFSGCCLLAFGDPKATLHDLRNKMQSLLETTCSQKTLILFPEKFTPQNLSVWLLIQKSHSAGPLQRHVSFLLWDFTRSPFGVSLFVLGMLSSVRQPFQIFNQQHNKIMGKWNEWWERVTLETHKNLPVATEIFLEFSPRKLRRSSNLTSIFFRWVGSTTN